MRDPRLKWVLVALVAVAIAAVPLVRRELLRREARAVISRYDIALAEATRVLDPTKLQPVAGQRQIGRVSDYILLLRGTGVHLESDLLGLEMLDVRSEDPTVTAKVNERWRFVQRSNSSGQQVGDTTTIDRVVEYTLVRSEGGTLTVELALFADEKQ